MDVNIQGVVFLVDDDMAPLIARFKWKVQTSHSSAGREYHYVRAFTNGGEVRLHRLIADAPRGMVVDHINGNTQDNRRKNLRVCTQGENCQNRQVKITNPLGAKGVNKSRGKFVAEVSASGKTYRAGTFSSFEEAIAARDVLAKKLHGEFFSPSVF
jgi:hypothetical protein